MAMGGTGDAVQRWGAGIAEWRQRHRWLNGEVVTSGVLLVASIYFFYASTRLGVSKGAQAAPGSFPALVSAGVIICSALWFFGLLLKLRRPEERTPAPSDTPVGEVIELIAEGSDDGQATGTVTEESAVWRVVFVVVWSAVCLPFTETIGMAPMLLVYLTGLLTVLARANPIKVVITLIIVLLLFSWGAYEGRIYIPDPFRIGLTIHHLFIGLLGK